MDFSGLLPNLKYSVQISAVLKSVFDNNTFLESNFSKPEIFQIHGRCQLQSSICSTFNHNCVPITTRAGTPDSGSLSFVIIFLGVLFFVVCGILFLCVVKKYRFSYFLYLVILFIFLRQCVFVKEYLKKADRKYPQETISLVYGMLDQKKFVNIANAILDVNEPIVGEPITVERFDKYFEEMSANNNELFIQQFEVCFFFFSIYFWTKNAIKILLASSFFCCSILRSK